MADSQVFTVDSMSFGVYLSAGVTLPTTGYFRVSTDGSTHISNFVVSAIAVSGNAAISGNLAVAGNVAVSGTTSVLGKLTANAGFVVSAISSLTGGVVMNSTLQVAGITSLDGVVNVAGQLNPAVTVNFIPAAGKLGFQTTIFTSVNVSAGFYIEIYTSGGTKLFIPARAAVP